MPRYYLHVHNSIGVTRDEEGQELADLAAAEKAAIDGVRSILGAEVLDGRLDLRGRIEIASDQDEVLRVIAFPDIVLVLRDDGL
jgi:hypothetical protein